MATRVGKQKEFADALKELLELEYDALEAYKASIDRIDKPEFKDQLMQFKSDHDKHIREITTLLLSKNITPPKGPSTKQWLTKGKVVIANLMGDKAILSAMGSNENDTNEAYENMCHHPEKWPEAEAILSKGLEDEKRHKAWLSKDF